MDTTDRFVTVEDSENVKIESTNDFTFSENVLECIGANQEIPNANGEEKTCDNFYIGR